MIQKENYYQSMNNYYNKKLKNCAKANRKSSTLAERILWKRLRKKQLFGFRFLRQRSISTFIVDFLQPDKKIIIEIDGVSHMCKYPYDLERQGKLIRERKINCVW